MYVLWRSVATWNATRHPFSSYAWASFAATVVIMGLATLWSYVFATWLHPNESMDFWRREERTWRDRVLGSVTVVGVVATTLLVLAYSAGYPSLAGAMAGPAICGLFLGIAWLTGGIRPLFPR